MTTNTVLQIKGSVTRAGDPRSEEARKISNGAIAGRADRPVRGGGGCDGRSGLRTARGLGASIRGWGHNVAGSARDEGGVVIQNMECLFVEHTRHFAAVPA